MIQNTVKEGTPEAHIAAVRSALCAIESEMKQKGVRSIHLDDWGRFSNFAIVVSPLVADTYRKKLENPQVARVVMAAIRNQLRIQGYKIETRLSRSWSDGRRSIDIDVNFHRYDRVGNSFHLLAA